MLVLNLMLVLKSLRLLKGPEDVEGLGVPEAVEGPWNPEDPEAVDGP